MHRSSVALALALLVLIGLAPGGLAASYGVSTSNDVGVPAQTVEIDGSTYQIDAVAEVSKGDQITASVAVDGEEDWTVDLYNQDEQIEDWEQGSGDGTASFDTSDLEPGTYALALEVDGKTQVLHPVVVSEYDLSVSAPDEIGADEQLEVTVDVGESVAADESVEVGIHEDGTELQAQASANGDGTYTATLTPDETGDWAVYAAVRAEGSAGGYPVSTGIANGQVVTVSESGSSDDGSGSDDDSGDGSDGDDGSASDGSGSDAGSGGDGDASSDTGGTAEDGSGDDSAGDGNVTDGGAAAPPQDDESDGGEDEAEADDEDAADTGATTGGDEATETDTNATDGDDPMEPNDPAENESDSDDELAIGWLIPMVALCAIALLGLARSDRS